MAELFITKARLVHGDKTLIRDNKIKEFCYNLVTIWENDWKKINKCIKIIQLKFKKYKY